MKKLLKELIEYEMSHNEMKEQGNTQLIGLVNLGFAPTSIKKRAHYTWMLEFEMKEFVANEIADTTLLGYKHSITDDETKELTDACSLYSKYLSDVVHLSFHVLPEYTKAPLAVIGFDIDDLISGVDDHTPLSHVYFIWHTWSERGRYIPVAGKTLVISMEQLCQRALQG